MHFSAVIAAAATLLSVATAAPKAAAPASKFYLFQIANVTGPNASKFNKLFLNPTPDFSALLGYSPVFDQEKIQATVFTFNQTGVTNNITFGTVTAPSSFKKVMALNMLYDLVPSTGWQPAMFKVGAPFATSNGFYIEGGKLLWTSDLDIPARGQFHGWLVCDWWVGFPQLFFRPEAYFDKFPSSCATMDLMAIPFNGQS